MIAWRRKQMDKGIVTGVIVIVDFGLVNHELLYNKENMRQAGSGEARDNLRRACLERNIRARSAHCHKCSEGKAAAAKFLRAYSVCALYKHNGKVGTVILTARYSQSGEGAVGSES